MAEPDELIEGRLEYWFRCPDLLRRALTHRSHAAEHTEDPDNEPLEFLGDAVLGFVVSEELFRKHPEAREGELSQWRAQFVSSDHLHRSALRLGLGKFLRLGHGEERSGGRDRKRLLANALEAIIAAVHIDGGFEAARTFICKHVLRGDAAQSVERPEVSNHKSSLQVHAQMLGLPLPRYVTVEVSGPEHAKQFTVEAKVGRWSARGTATSKKVASQVAAERLMSQLTESSTPG